MEIAYLGLFQRVFEWVLSHILDPVYNFVSNLLTTVLTWVFDTILAPILMPILKEALNFFIDLWLELYSTQLYLLFSGVLKLIDYLQTAFDVFIGLKDVSYTEAGGRVITGSLVEVLMQQKTVSTVFWVITLGALGLALMLTVFATAKSVFDLDFENKRPVSKVLAAMMKTFVQFFTVPFFVYFLLRLAAVILKGVTSALSSTGNTTLGRIVFMIASLDAAKQEAYNLSTASGGIVLGTSPADQVRYPFYVIGANGTSTRDYGDLEAVTEYFDLAAFDYLIGFIAAIFLLFTIGVCLIVFVQRIFELVLLYIVSPYFVSMIPLDDGEKFGRWREMFVAKCFTGFGSAIGMRLYLMVCPMVMGNQIRFGTATSPEMDYMMKLFFLAGGAWAVFKSGSLITSLLSYQAGMSEANTAAIASGMLYSYTAGAVIGKGRQVISSAFHGRGGHGGGGGAGGADGAGGPGGGSMFTDVQGPDAVKQKYTGVSGWATRKFMGSDFVNKKVNKALNIPKKALAKSASVTKTAGKVAGGISTFSGWFAGSKKAPEDRNRLQRAAFKISDKTGHFRDRTNDAVTSINQMGRRIEEVQGATQNKWGLLSLEFGQQAFQATEKPQKLDIQIGRHRALNRDSTVGVDKQGNVSSWQFATPQSRRANGAYYRPTYKMASEPTGEVKKTEAKVGGSDVKYSDVSIKGLNVNSSEVKRHTISAGSYSGRELGGGSSQAGGSGSSGGSQGSANIRHTISGGSYSGGSSAGGSSGGSGSESSANIRHTISGGSGSYSGSGSGSSGSGAGGSGGESSANIRHTISGGSGSYTSSGSGSSGAGGSGAGGSSGSAGGSQRTSRSSTSRVSVRLDRRERK